MGSSILDITKDIQSLTNFRRRSAQLLKQLKKSKRPMLLTVKGKAAAIVQDAEAYQRLLDIASSAEAEEGIRAGFGRCSAWSSPGRQNRYSSETRHRHGIPR